MRHSFWVSFCLYIYKKDKYNIYILNIRGENIGEFTKELGGHKVTDPELDWHKDPGTGMGLFNLGGGWCKEPRIG